ncbi:MAG: UDP-N-acetylmuramate dehydrogenase [Fusobacteriaceae bacterium]|jgi:UDP-N-acetylmuramate dehydrogenase|nr:UDP-N-acetylmuramate dehydrogenase [Fusobacteriaceae bacterium]
MIVYKNYSMKNKSNMKIGGIAKTYIEVEDKNELIEIYSKYKNIFLIGNGTNTLLSDSILDYTFVSLRKLNKITNLPEQKVKSEAGLDFKKLMKYMYEKNYSGLENLAGIPGTVGGLVYMNGGAYGSQIFDCIDEIEIFDKNLQIKTLKKSDIKHSYRNTEIQEKKWVIISVTFNFTKGFDLEKVKEIQNLRESKQPLNLPSLGSTFKNPTTKFAAKLISEAGLKGTIIGSAKISEKHPNFIVNLGEATFLDIINILALIKGTVKEKTGILLEEEIIIVK